LAPIDGADSGGEHLVEGDASLDCVVTEATPGPGREQGTVAETAPFLEPDTQNGDGASSQRDAALFGALPKATDMCPVAEFDVTAVGPGQFGEPEPCMQGERHQGVITSTLPPAAIRSGEQGDDLLRLEERHVALVEALLGNGQHLLDQLGVLGVAKSGVSEQRPQCGETSVPAAGAVVSLGFEVVQEGRDHPNSEVLPVEGGGSLPRSACTKLSRRVKVFR
jgi:hypothetical protein